MHTPYSHTVALQSSLTSIKDIETASIGATTMPHVKNALRSFAFCRPNLVKLLHATSQLRSLHGLIRPYDGILACVASCMLSRPDDLVNVLL